MFARLSFSTPSLNTGIQFPWISWSPLAEGWLDYIWPSKHWIRSTTPSGNSKYWPKIWQNSRQCCYQVAFANGWKPGLQIRHTFKVRKTGENYLATSILFHKPSAHKRCYDGKELADIWFADRRGPKKYYTALAFRRRETCLKRYSFFWHFSIFGVVYSTSEFF